MPKGQFHRGGREGGELHPIMGLTGDHTPSRGIEYCSQRRYLFPPLAPTRVGGVVIMTSHAMVMDYRPRASTMLARSDLSGLAGSGSVSQGCRPLL